MLIFIAFVIGFIIGNYKSSDSKTFLYIGPDIQKYNNAFIGILIK